MKKIQSVFYDSFLEYINQVKAKSLPATSNVKSNNKPSVEPGKTRRLSGSNITMIHGQSFGTRSSNKII